MVTMVAMAAAVLMANAVYCCTKGHYLGGAGGALPTQ